MLSVITRDSPREFPDEEVDKFLEFGSQKAKKLLKKEDRDGLSYELYSSAGQDRVVLVKDLTKESPLTVGYLYLEGKEGGYKEDVVQISNRYQGKNIGPTMYDFILNDFSKEGLILFSDLNHTPGAQRMWQKFFQKYKGRVKGYFLDGPRKGETFELEEKDRELASSDKSISLYHDPSVDNEKPQVKYCMVILPG